MSGRNGGQFTRKHCQAPQIALRRAVIRARQIPQPRTTPQLMHAILALQNEEHTRSINLASSRVQMSVICKLHLTDTEAPSILIESRAIAEATRDAQP